MDKLHLINSTQSATAIELIVTDTSQNQRKALLFIDEHEKWFDGKVAKSDLIEFWAGKMINIAKEDNKVSMVQAQAYRVIDGITRKSFTFCTQLRHKGVFKSVFLKTDGTFDFI